jgi:beta-lactamase superfamily II metal-dependent hydrolase
MFNGLEVDMVDLGDADCMVVTQWTPTCACRVLIDGGSGSDAEVIKEFFRIKNYTDFYAVVCSHPHNDHAAGLIKVVQDMSITIGSVWMHDIRNHLSPDSLRRASSGSSAQAEGVKQVVETTKELARALGSRSIPVHEPYAGQVISYVPSLTVLGPDEHFYKSTLEDFTKVDVPNISSLSLASAMLAGKPPVPSYRSPLPPPPALPNPFLPPQMASGLSALLEGVLSNSSVKESPTTQPFNNTSVILGCLYGGQRLLFTADAGADALDRVPSEWKDLAWMQVPHHGSDGNLSQSNIECFCPKFAYISAKGDASHPSRAIVNGLIKVGAQVASTHMNRNMWYGIGAPLPNGYGPLVLLKSNAAQ